MKTIEGIRPGAYLRGEDFTNNYREMYFERIDLSGANLRDAILTDSNFSNANLDNTDLREASLWLTNLSNASLRNANLRDADLRGTNLKGAIFQAPNGDKYVVGKGRVE